MQYDSDNGRKDRAEVSYSIAPYGNGWVQFGFLKDWRNGNHDYWFLYSRTLGMDGVG